VRTVNRYYLVGETISDYDQESFIYESFYNSVQEEAKLRGRIQFLLQDNPIAKLHIIYGDDITSRFIEKGEDEKNGS